MKNEIFEVRDLRDKGKFIIDDKFLNGYARFLGIYAVGVYSSLCRHANKQQKCWPSIKKIAEELGCGRNSVIEALKRMEFWQIIRKIRIGKKVNNRYELIDKKYWKSINKAYMEEFSEVCHINFKGLSDKLQGFIEQTSIVRKHNSKETQKKGKEFSSFNKNTDTDDSIKDYDGSLLKAYLVNSRTCPRKPYFWNHEMRYKKDKSKWYVMYSETDWKDFAGEIKEIDWKLKSKTQK